MADASDTLVLDSGNTWLCNELLNTHFIPRRRVRWIFEDEVITTMHLFKARAQHIWDEIVL